MCTVLLLGALVPSEIPEHRLLQDEGLMDYTGLALGSPVVGRGNASSATVLLTLSFV